MSLCHTHSCVRTSVRVVLGSLVWTLVTLAMTFGGAGADDYLCGDANGDVHVDVGDAVYIIQYVFNQGPAPIPRESGDCNNDDACNVGDAVYLIGYIFKGGPSPICGPSSVLISVIGCKTFGRDEGILPDQGCLEFSYDGENILTLFHRNAGFNCCAIVQADVSVDGSLIRIIESESFDSLGSCDCLCLYDLEFILPAIPPGQYTVEITELYLAEEDQALAIGIELTAATSSGQYCLPRSQYPWGEEYSPSGAVVGSGGCKMFDRGGDGNDIPPTSDCFSFAFDGAEMLHITHLNAGFNCCPIIDADIEVADNIITIRESESYDTPGPCDCLCLFDVDYDITGLKEGTYIVRIYGLYTQPENDYLEYEMVLHSTATTGEFCRERTYYPWGEW